MFKRRVTVGWPGAVPLDTAPSVYGAATPQAPCGCCAGPAQGTRGFNAILTPVGPTDDAQTPDCTDDRALQETPT
jgi:hypothetical protein